MSEDEIKEMEAELEFLRWFYGECDFGPAHGDVIEMYHEQWTKETGKPVPPGYGRESDE